MKQYANFQCDHNMGHGILYPWPRDPPQYPLTLEWLQRQGWKVINTAIRTGAAYVAGQPTNETFTFLLEYEWPTDDPRWRR